MSYNAKVQLTSTSGTAVIADSSPAPIPDLNGRDGWLYQKSSGAEKFNYYIWGQGSHALRLGDLNNVYMVGAVDTYTNVASVPFIVIYTKMTGSGDAGAWYHSRISYSIDSSQVINLGEIVQFYSHNRSTSSINGYRQVPLNVEIKTGEALPTEEILYITLHSDSGGANDTSILISKCGYVSNHLNPQYLNLELSSY
jgi:hypothetical protein|tara:strand:- start:4230 stop:4820 length:591 start_codon:yes stop_codon:yes gene_type:complete